MENLHLYWWNSLFLLPFSIAMLDYVSHEQSVTFDNWWPQAGWLRQYKLTFLAFARRSAVALSMCIDFESPELQKWKFAKMGCPKMYRGLLRNRVLQDDFRYLYDLGHHHIVIHIRSLKIPPWHPRSSHDVAGVLAGPGCGGGRVQDEVAVFPSENDGTMGSCCTTTGWWFGTWILLFLLLSHI